MCVCVLQLWPAREKLLLRLLEGLEKNVKCFTSVRLQKKHVFLRVWLGHTRLHSDFKWTRQSHKQVIYHFVNNVTWLQYIQLIKLPLYGLIDFESIAFKTCYSALTLKKTRRGDKYLLQCNHLFHPTTKLYNYLNYYTISTYT